MILDHCVHRFLGTEMDTFLQKFERKVSSKKKFGYDTFRGCVAPNFPS